MRKVCAALAMVVCVSAHAQTREVTDSGTFDIDAAGRYVRLEAPDGVVVRYLYDDARSTEPSGVAVQPNEKVTLTVRYQRGSDVAVSGLPAITTIVDHEGRTTAVHADGKPAVLIEYAQSGLVAAVTLPSRLRWKIAPPDASHHVQQSIEDPKGKVVATSVLADLDEVQRRAWYDAAASELGVELQSLTYEQSGGSALTTARDAQGRVAFYVVHTDGFDVGFSPDGTPRFYDLPLSVFAGTIAPGGDVVFSPSWDAQHSAVPDHVVLTARGATGLYVESAARNAIAAAWTDATGRKRTVVHTEPD